MAIRTESDKTNADHENDVRDGRISNQAREIARLKAVIGDQDRCLQTVADAAGEAGNLAENRTVGMAFSVFARLIRKNTVKAGD